MKAARQSLKRNETAGVAITCVLAFVVAGWASIAEISGAVIGQGTVVPREGSKDVQHLEGGIIREITVLEGQRVEAGMVVAKLDDAQSRATLGIIESQIIELSAELARLESERVDLPTLSPVEVSSMFAPPDALERAVASQRSLLASLRESQDKKKEQLVEQIAQTRSAVTGLEANLAGNEKQSEMLKSEIDILGSLKDKGLAPRNTIVAMKREQAQLQGQAGELQANIARLKTKISEIELKIIEVVEQRRSEVIARLSEVRSRLASLREQREFELGRLRRAEILAPVAGHVHELKINSRGGVISPGQTVMTIVPANAELIVRAQIRPQDIDHVAVGQPTRLRFTTMKRRTSPELQGTVTVVGADQTADTNSRMSWYSVEVSLNPGELEKMHGHTLRAGMPVETFITTAQRTVLGYLVQPFTDSMEHVFRD